MTDKSVKIAITNAMGTKHLLDCVNHVRPIEPSGLGVVDAVCSVVIGQMLSRTAANSIKQRVFARAAELGKQYSAELDAESLRECGLSRRKIKTIHLFYDNYLKDQARYDNWKHLSPEHLFLSVEKEWGMSHWTASMLAIFHFGMEDVYPLGDGTIIKVERRLKEQGIIISPDRAQPYRSYFALFLWSLVDEGYI
ncbi:hypothetical protein [Endozoicomonas acroporae]|uniref:hypothetical protein n=1 Tax=Endozoicomonas acroporae TaxID=1701104 RepID=UPI003D794967